MHTTSPYGHIDWIELKEFKKPNTKPNTLDPFEVIAYYRTLKEWEEKYFPKKTFDRTGPEYTKPKVRDWLMSLK